MPSKKGFFLVLEGIDRCGKSTQAKLLASFFKKRGRPLLHTREPGGTALGEKIRDLILMSPGFFSNRAELLLYEASRAQHVEAKVIPALKEGRLVICERYTLATLAYQSFGRGLPLDQVKKLNDFATFSVKPDLTLVLDIPVAVFKKRAGKFLDRMENKINFLKLVRRGYLKLAKSLHCVLIDATCDHQTLHRNILAALRTHGVY